VDRLHLVGRAGVAALDITGEYLDRLMTQVLRDLVNRATVAVGRCGIKARRKGAAEAIHVTGACRLKNVIAIRECRLEAIEMNLERAPAFKAVRIGDRQLGLMQLGVGVDRAKLDEPLLGGLPKPIETRVRGQDLRHGIPSFLTPGDRNSRARKKEMSAEAEGGFDPLRGPLVACSTGREAISG
jgi:hypothetical protein